MPSPRPTNWAAAFRPASLIASTLTILIGTAFAQQCSAASDCDVNIIKVNSVEIDDDKLADDDADDAS